MFINRCFDSKFPLHLLIASHWSLASAILALLLIFGCGNETINNPLGGSAEGTRETEDLVLVSSIYYPMTVGSRWVYRSADGSEWWREVTKTEGSWLASLPFLRLRFPH